MTPAALDVLTQYAWPGNVRELANLVERLSILYPNGMVDVHDLPGKYRSGDPVQATPEADARLKAVSQSVSRLPPEGIDLKKHLAKVEASLVEQALDETGWVVAHAAKRLRMGRTTLVEKMRKLGLQRQGDVSGI